MDNVFKMPEELDMTQQEKAALVTVMHMMEAGEIVFQSRQDFHLEKVTGDRMFNMSDYGSEVGDSGKYVGCIGFWMGVQMGMDYVAAKEYVRKQQEDTTKLKDLIWGSQGISLTTYNTLTPDMAAKTIRSFLENGVVDLKIGLLTQDPY